MIPDVAKKDDLITGGIHYNCLCLVVKTIFRFLTRDSDIDILTVMGA